MREILRSAAMVVMACLAAMPFSARAAEGDNWDWMIAPYGWATSFGMDLRTGQPPTGGADADVGFDNIIDKIDGVFQVHAEGQGDNFGMFTDFTYLGLADDKAHPRFRTESDLDARLFELAVVWSPGAERHQGVELFAGLRYIDVDVSVALRPENPAFDGTSLDAGKNYSDFMLGARYTWALSERWGLTLRGDGSFGDTDGTWSASAIANYRTKHGAWLFGYRYLDIELESSSNEFHMTMQGPTVGYGFMF